MTETANPTATAMKKKRGCWIPMLAIALVLFVLVLINLPYGNWTSKTITVGKETTYLTGPVRPDGGVDYVKALNDLGLQDSQLNLATHLFRLLKVKRVRDPDDLTQAEYETMSGLLGYEKLPEPLTFYRAFEVMDQKTEADTGRLTLQQSIDSANTFQDLQTPWNSLDFPGWLEVIQAQSKILDFVALSVQNSTYCFQPVIPEVYPDHTINMFYTLVPLVELSRNLSREFNARAMNSIAEGNIDSAIADARSIRRLAFLFSNNGTLLHHASALGILSTAQLAELEILNHGGLTELQLHALSESILQNPCQTTAVSIVDQRHRIMTLDLLQTIHLDGSAQAIPMSTHDKNETTVFRLLAASSDHAAAMRSANRMFNQFAEIDKMESMRARLNAAEQIEPVVKEVLSRMNQLHRSGWSLLKGSKTRGRFLGKLMASRDLLVGINLLNSECRRACQDDVTLAAIAIERYWIKNRQMPSNLDSLVPEFLDSRPWDQLNDCPLIFKTGTTTDRENNSFLVYGKGPDGVDNGGRISNETATWHLFDTRAGRGLVPKPQPGSEADSAVQKKFSRNPE